MSQITCPRCDNRYPNNSRAGHCGGCHETFIGLGAFDAHRVGPHGPERRCEVTVAHWADKSGHWHIGERGAVWWKEAA